MFVNLYWQLNGQRPESNTVVLSEHGFLQVGYFQLKITLAEIQTFLHHAPYCSQTASLLPCSCLASFCSHKLEEMLKCGFMLRELCPPAWHKPPFFTPDLIYRFSPSYWGTSVFCVSPLPPSAQLVSPPCFLALQHIWLILCPVILPHNLVQPLSPLPLDTDLMLKEWPRPLRQQCLSLVPPTPVFAQP